MVPLLFIIVVLLVIVLIFYKKNRNTSNYTRGGSYELDKPLIGKEDSVYDNSAYSRVVAVDDNEMTGENIAGKTLDTLFKMYPSDYKKPSMKEALLKADLTEEQADKIVKACKDASEFAKENGLLFEGFTEEDAAAVAMYTYDFGSDEFESNPYRIIITSLVGRNYSSLQRASGILYLVMTALRKLPRVTGTTLYRGVRSGEVRRRPLP